MDRFKQLLFGGRKNPLDPSVFHNLSLIAFFAWVGLGADGLSSSCYGPEEAFLSLGGHPYLAIWLAIAVMATVWILSSSYCQIIEHFPTGGGGYLVASKLVGKTPGLISGCALIVDYVLTISISVAASSDAIFSFLPVEWLPWKLWMTVACLGVLIVLNLRGVKESVVILTPIFLVFVGTHVFLVLYGIFSHGSELPSLVNNTLTDTRASVNEVGMLGVFLILVRAFSLGGGTFTGIEAVSNSMSLLREPRVETGKRTMRYMAWSLSLMAGGLIINYLLNHVQHEPGRTLNATLFQTITAQWEWGGTFTLITLLSEGALLLVAAQAGFLGGPQVMSNMSIDRWLPSRFTSLSDRLVMKDGIFVMGAAALATIWYTGGSVKILVVMYSINVFLTFTLSQLGMVIHWFRERKGQWKHGLLINGSGMFLTAFILMMTIVLKFREGGWVTLVVTGAFIVACWLIRHHYRKIFLALMDLNKILSEIPIPEGAPPPQKLPNAPTAVLMVNGYNGIGIHSLLAIQRFFPGHFKNFVFVSVGVIDSGRFKGAAEIDSLKTFVDDSLKKYVALANGFGFYAESRAGLGTDIIDELELLCEQVGKEWDRKVFFMGQLAFEGETFWTRMLHNQTSFALQRKLLFNGHEAVILPIRLRIDETSKAS